MKLRLSLGLVLTGLMVVVLLIGCGDDTQRIMSPADSGWPSGTDLSTGLTDTATDDAGGIWVVQDGYTWDDYFFDDSDTITVVEEPDEAQVDDGKYDDDSFSSN